MVRGGLIQTKVTHEGGTPWPVIKQAMIEKNLKFIEEAARRGCQVVCLQELFYGPYFPALRQQYSRLGGLFSKE